MTNQIKKSPKFFQVPTESYLTWVEAFLEKADYQEIGWMLVKHLIWRRLRIPMHVRVKEIIERCKLRNQREYREASGQKIFQKASPKYLNPRSKQVRVKHDFETDIRGY